MDVSGELLFDVAFLSLMTMMMLKATIIVVAITHTWTHGESYESEI